MADRQTGYPSIDKPWLKYYDEEAINTPLPKCTMYRYMWEKNKDYPADIAFRYFGTKITYEKLFENIKRTVKAFAAMGIKSGDMVTIMSMHTPETIYCIYALNYIGATANLIYMTLSEKEILDAIVCTGSKLFLALDPAAERISHIRKDIHIPVVLLSVADSMPFAIAILYRMKNKVCVDGIMNFREFLKRSGECELPVESTTHETTAVICYTSGSTGKPKGVMLSNDALNAHVFQDVNGIFGFERKLTFLFILPPFIGYGISHLHTFLCAGMELILQIRIEPENVTKALYKNKTQCFLGTPAYIDEVMESRYKNRDLSWLLYFVGGGGEVTEEKEKKFNEYLRSHNSTAKYSCGYGMTEASSTLCANCNDISKIGSVGIPFFMTEVKVVDQDTEKELPYGEVGELHFYSPNNMAGYFHNDEATKEIMYWEDGKSWLRSGDLGYVDQEGFVFVTGRIKRICFTRAKDGFSYKLFPQRIEELLQTDSDIEHCGVITKEDEQRINVAVAFVTLRNKSIPQEKRDDVRTRLFDLAAKELPEHEQPTDIIIIDTMPLTPSGKIDYRALRK